MSHAVAFGGSVVAMLSSPSDSPQIERVLQEQKRIEVQARSAHARIAVTGTRLPLQHLRVRA
jgi:hypothetical protein